MGIMYMMLLLSCGDPGQRRAPPVFGSSLCNASGLDTDSLNIYCTNGFRMIELRFSGARLLSLFLLVVLLPEDSCCTYLNRTNDIFKGL